MVKTIYDPRQKGLPLDPEPTSAKFEEICKELVAVDAENKKYRDRKKIIEQIVDYAELTAPRSSSKSDKKWKAPPAFADGTSAVINKRRRRP